MFNPRSIKAQLILFLLLLAGFIIVKDNDVPFLAALTVCVITAIGVEALALYRKTQKWQVTESAVIVGIIVGYVASSGVAWWKLAAVAALAILSKHLIRFHHKHIFNPAAMGLVISIVLLGVPTQWKATYLWYFLMPLGGYLAWKIRRLEVLAGYAAVSLMAFAGQALVQHTSLTAIGGYFSYFYVFIMLIEPKTTPSGVVAKYLFGGATAGLVFVLMQSSLSFEIELLSLLMMNAAVPILNKIPIKKGGSA